MEDWRKFHYNSIWNHFRNIWAI